MKLNIDEKKYKIEKRKGFQGDFSYKVTQKKRTCKACGKGFESTGNETLSWYDDDGFYRIGYFCKTDYINTSRYLKAMERKGLN
tara:strand:- start:2 stop:253 length:252 start_codon:yes stop_codon:yes gene_type:complete